MKTYKVSASLVDSYTYYMSNRSNQAFESIKDRVNGIFRSNFFMQRGLDFEDEVFDGRHGKLSELTKDLPKQTWASKTIEVDGISVRISAKMDVIDQEKKRIYDIKRVSKYSKGKYDRSVQHLFYFYLMPEMKDFYYLIAVGNKDIVTKVAHYRRPKESVLEGKVISIISEFFNFLKENDLWEDYLKNNEYKGFNRDKKA